MNTSLEKIYLKNNINKNVYSNLSVRYNFIHRVEFQQVFVFLKGLQ